MVCRPCQTAAAARVARAAQQQPLPPIEYVVITGDGSESQFGTLLEARSWQAVHGGRVRTRAVTGS